MQAIAFALPVIAGKEDALEAFALELKNRLDQFAALRRREGVSREAAFLQRTPYGSSLINYQERDVSAASQPASTRDFDEWMSARLTDVLGFDPASIEPPPVEALVRRHAFHRGNLYALAIPVVPNKTGRFREFANELNGIHEAEYDESLRRFKVGVTLFLQQTPGADLVITVIEADEPATALGRLAASSNAFDRWHMGQIAELHGLDLSAPPPPPNRQLWSWDASAVPSR
jgi:hypothetical protein